MPVRLATIASIMLTMIVATIVFPQFCHADRAAGESRVEEVQEQIDKLRRQARYTDAKEIALDLVAYCREDSTLPDYQIINAEWLLKTVGLAADLNEIQQRELATADSL